MKDAVSIYTGKHLIVDFCYLSKSKVAEDILLDVEKGKYFVAECIAASGMTLVSPISATSYLNADSEQTSGYSLTAHLQESHITIHTWPENGLFTFDMFTCKWFDENVILDIIGKVFGLGPLRAISAKASVLVIDRNTELDKIPVEKINRFY